MNKLTIADIKQHFNKGRTVVVHSEIGTKLFNLKLNCVNELTKALSQGNVSGRVL